MRPERHVPHSIATMRIRLIRALAPQLLAMPRDRRLIVIAPDWLAWTMGYYFLRAGGEPIHALGTWNHPEIYNPDASPWYDPALVNNAQAQILSTMRRRNGYLAFIVDPEVRDSGGIPYSKSLALEAALRRHLSVEYDRTFPSPREPAELIILARRAPQGRQKKP